MAYTGSKALQGKGAQLSIGPTANAAPPPTGLTGTTTSASPNLALSAAPSVSIIGDTVVGTGIPANTTILSGTGTAYVMSANASATGSTGTLTFTLNFTPIFELNNQPFKPQEYDKLEVTNFNSTAKEYIKGMSDSGTVPIEGNTVWNDPGQIALAAAYNDASNAYQFKLQMPKAPGQSTTGDTYAFNGLVFSYTPLGDFDPKKTVAIKGEIQITGPISYTAGS